jgi:hypothetical protein
MGANRAAAASNPQTTSASAELSRPEKLKGRDGVRNEEEDGQR